MTPIRTIETPRLRLVPVGTTARAENDYVAVLQNPEVTHFLEAVPDHYTPEDAREFIPKCAKSIAEGRAYVWDIMLREDPAGRIIGNLNYSLKENGDFSRGFWLDAEFHGRGIMPEAVAVTTDFIFDEVGVSKILVFNALLNHKSHRVQEKTGCRFIGKLDKMTPKGMICHECWELTAADWRAWKAVHPEMNVPEL